MDFRTVSRTGFQIAFSNWFQKLFSIACFHFVIRNWNQEAEWRGAGRIYHILLLQLNSVRVGRRRWAYFEVVCGRSILFSVGMSKSAWLFRANLLDDLSEAEWLLRNG